MSYHDYEDIDQGRPLDRFERWDWLDRHENMHLFMRNGKLVTLPPQLAEKPDSAFRGVTGLLFGLLFSAPFWLLGIYLYFLRYYR